ncbi:oligosaccharide flippase family protein [Thaumasiovibrio subtropicus]|uniref:oligosaccharide flippase family protein n=1 Tax=Thaumasiovibrio subtropicus TaxID=1891207 RepID=UPI000B356A6F|nr:oligosaccharide flippase family protein [Thaumasiovibrio subtropicus]
MSSISVSSPQHQYLRNGTLVVSLGVVVGFICDYLFNLTLSRTLESHTYGDYKVAYAFATTASVFCLLGGDRIAPRLLSERLARGENQHVWYFLKFYLIVAMVTSFTVILLTAIGSYFHLGVTDTQDHHPLLKMSFVIPLIAVGALLSRILQSAKQLAWSNLPWRIGLPLAKIGAIWVMFYSLPSLTLSEVILAGATTVVVIIAWQWHKIRQLNLVDVEAHHDTAPATEWLKLSIPMMLAMLVTMVMNQVDLFMLEAMATEHEVGVFAAASTTAHFIPIIQTTVAGLFLPLIAPAIANDGDGGFQLFKKGMLWVSVAVILVCGVLFLSSHVLLGLFGDDYTEANMTLYLLIGAYGIWGVASFSSTWLQYLKRSHLVLKIGGVALLVDVVANLLLIPPLGIEGAALATLLALGSAALLTLLAMFNVMRAGVFTVKSALK